MISQKYSTIEKVPHWQEQQQDVTSSITSGGLAATIASAAAWRAASTFSVNIESI